MTYEHCLISRQLTHILFHKIFPADCFNRHGFERNMFPRNVWCTLFYKQCIDNHVLFLSACEKLAGIFLIGVIILTGYRIKYKKKKEKNKKIECIVLTFNWKCQKSKRMVCLWFIDNGSFGTMKGSMKMTAYLSTLILSLNHIWYNRFFLLLKGSLSLRDRRSNHSFFQFFYKLMFKTSKVFFVS